MESGRFGRNEIDAVCVDFDDLRALCFQPFDHLFEQVAPDLGDAGGGLEIAKFPCAKPR